MRSSPSQLQLGIPGQHGGKRRGAGRKNRTGLRGHAARPILDRKFPVHVTLKLAPGLPSLRKKEIFRSFRAAIGTARVRGIKVAHFAILSNHVHLIMEASEQTIARQMQSLCISFSKRFNALLERSGSVFFDRYHLSIIRTPTQMRNALAYVLTNQARHWLRSQKSPIQHDALTVRFDPYSSANSFRKWKELFGNRVRFEFSNWSETFIEDWHREILTKPKTWLLSRGWLKVGFA